MKYALLILILAACTPRSNSSSPSTTAGLPAGDSPPATASPTPPAQLADINGIWKTDCHMDSDSPETTYQVKTAKFSKDGTLEYISEAHLGTDKKCAGAKVLTTILQGRYKAPESPGDLRPLDLNFERRILIPGSLESVRMFNEMKVCGISDWAAGVARDVSGSNCESGTGPSTQSIFSVLRVEKDAFKMGKDTMSTDGSSLEKRHASLSDVRFLKATQ